MCTHCPAFYSFSLNRDTHQKGSVGCLVTTNTHKDDKTPAEINRQACGKSRHTYTLILQLYPRTHNPPPPHFYPTDIQSFPHRSVTICHFPRVPRSSHTSHYFSLRRTLTSHCAPRTQPRRVDWWNYSIFGGWTSICDGWTNKQMEGLIQPNCQ